MLKSFISMLKNWKNPQKTDRSKSAYSRKAIVEQLEDRRMLAVCPAQLPDLDVPMQSAVVSAMNLGFDTSNALVTFGDASESQFNLLSSQYNTWIGSDTANDSGWQNAANWSLGQVPTGDQTIVINVGTTVTLSGNYNITNMDCAGTLIVSGNMTIAGEVNISGLFQLEKNASLTVTGDDASFIVSGSTILNGGRLFVQDGASADLGDLVSFGAGRVDVAASGWGSNIDLSSLTTFANGSLTATNGGSISCDALTTLDHVTFSADGDSWIDINALTTIRDSKLELDGGFWSFGSVTTLERTDIAATGAYVSFGSLATMTMSGTTMTVSGGMLDFSNLTTIINSGATASAFSASNGAYLGFWGLTTVNNTGAMNFAADGLNSMVDLSSLTALSNGSLTAQNGGVFFNENLATLDGVALSVDGNSWVDINALTTIRDSKLELDGGFWSFDNVTTLERTDIGAVDAYVSFASLATMTTSGTTMNISGGMLDFSNLTSIVDTGATASVFAATNGAYLGLWGLTTIQHAAPMKFLAEGWGGMIDLSSLTTFADGSLTVKGGGTIFSGNLTTIDNVILSVDNVSGFNTNALTTIRDSNLELNGGFWSFGKVTTLERTDISATDAYASFAILESMTTSGTTIAVSGGMVDFSSLICIVDTGTTASVFSSTNGAYLGLWGLLTIKHTAPMHFSADGWGSMVDLSSLTSFENGSLTASNGGMFFSENLAMLDGVTLSVDGNSWMDVNALTTILDSKLELNGGFWSFGNVTMLERTNIAATDAFVSFAILETMTTAGTTVSVAGGMLDFSNLTTIIDTGATASVFSVSNGGYLGFWCLTTIRHTAPMHFSADGAGSMLDLTSLKTFSNGTLKATNGGTILGQLPLGAHKMAKVDDALYDLLAEDVHKSGKKSSQKTDNADPWLEAFEQLSAQGLV